MRARAVLLGIPLKNIGEATQTLYNGQIVNRVAVEARSSVAASSFSMLEYVGMLSLRVMSLETFSADLGPGHDCDDDHLQASGCEIHSFLPASAADATPVSSTVSCSMGLEWQQ